MSRISLSNLTFEAKSGDQLEDVSMELVSPQMVAICSNDDGATSSLEQLVTGAGKVLDGKVSVDGRDLKYLRRHHDELIANLAETDLRGRMVEKAIKKACRHQDGALSVDATLKMLQPLGLQPDTKLAALNDRQQQELKIIILLALRRPVVVLGRGLDQLEEQARLTMGQLLKDYAQKTNSLVLFTSENVSTMMRFADVIYYFNGSHLTSVRALRLGDGVDCTVTVTGTGLPVEMAVRMGAHMLEEAPNETRFLYTGNIQALLPLLEQSTITDVRIEDASVEDELMAY
ncbi:MULTISPECIES: P-loop NTPase family protein [Limosilactobacillus]|uniref:multidrug ABC transporter ATPase n=1 Tax=Limosilactobacillus TaxID=2742598 RepID=UPI0022467613|nr:multidrug ABC transporter ATPase [Limosilactobacillus pontis]MCX2187103.1 multidrug ABC transporter ATPase [Limosilactobacillus pontis]MCX2188907.1 multidrug ABC transporter ATPase [Limosilactobacillus pontis]